MPKQSTRSFNYQVPNRVSIMNKMFVSGSAQAEVMDTFAASENLCP
jgi:hypothetical protein